MFESKFSRSTLITNERPVGSPPPTAISCLAAAANCGLRQIMSWQTECTEKTPLHRSQWIAGASDSHSPVERKPIVRHAISLFALGVIVVGLLCGTASAAPLYFNGFETNIAGWDAFAASYHPTRVASGTNGITSASGSFHAVSSATGSAGNWGGYNYGAGNAVPTTFQEYITSVDIYLDVNAGAANDTRFDFSSAINNNSGTFRRDFIFNAGFYNDGTGPGANTNRFVISASNNSQPGSAYAKNPGRGPIAISTTGWYTFEHHFYNNAGVLAVDMSIYDSSNLLVNSWTLSDIVNDAISNIGGNRYGWFDYNQFSVLAFDNSQLTVIPEPSGLALLGIGAAALLRYRRRRRVAGS